MAQASTLAVLSLSPKSLFLHLQNSMILSAVRRQFIVSSITLPVPTLLHTYATRTYQNCTVSTHTRSLLRTFSLTNITPRHRTPSNSTLTTSSNGTPPTLQQASKPEPNLSLPIHISKPPIPQHFLPSSQRRKEKTPSQKILHNGLPLRLLQTATQLIGKDRRRPHRGGNGIGYVQSVNFLPLFLLLL